MSARHLLAPRPAAARSAGRQRPLSAWRRAASRDLADLHAWYLRPEPDPFVIEISGPDPGMSRREFCRWCRDRASMLVRREDGAVDAFLWFSYIQATIGVAQVDWRFAAGEPRPRTRAQGAFAAAFHRAISDLGLRKVHALTLPHQRERQRLAASLGFQEEGVLREHFFHAGRLQDLICLGWRPRRESP